MEEENQGTPSESPVSASKQDDGGTASESRVSASKVRRRRTEEQIVDDEISGLEKGLEVLRARKRAIEERHREDATLAEAHAVVGEIIIGSCSHGNAWARDVLEQARKVATKSQQVQLARVQLILQKRAPAPGNQSN